MKKVSCCNRRLPDWAVYETPLPFVARRGRVRVRPGNEVCGDCVTHALKTGVINQEAYHAIAARPADPKERARTAHEFE